MAWRPRRVHLLLAVFTGVGALVLFSADPKDVSQRSAAPSRAGPAGATPAAPAGGDGLLMVATRVAAAGASVPHVDLFSDRRIPPASMVAAPVGPAISAPAASPTPVAPPLPFTVFGKKFEAGAWEVYLVEGNNTLVGRVGERLDTVYSVDSIAPPVMTLTYLPLRTVQTVQIGDAQ